MAPGRLRPTLRPAERVAYGGLLAAVAAAAGFALAGVPNVELVTFVVCVSGVLYGPGVGVVVGVVGEALFSLGNPLGPAPPMLLVGQVAGMAAAGVLGGGVGRLSFPRDRVLSAVAWGTVGVIATLIFHVATDGTYALMARLTWAYLLAGVPFYLVHLVSNAVLFAVAMPLVVEAARARLGPRGAGGSA